MSRAGGDTEVKVFVATRLEGVPPGLSRYASVDGSVAGAAVTWDHHVSGESINLDAMPSVIDTTFDGVGTTLADTDALISVLAVLFGGVSKLPRIEILRSACWWCDHLRGAPEATPEEADAGEALHRWVSQQLRLRGDAAFGVLAEELFMVLSQGGELPRLEAKLVPLVGRWSLGSPVAVVRLEEGEHLDPALVYQRTGCTLAVLVKPHSAGGAHYTIGLHPAEDRDLAPLLYELARLEHAHGLPCLGSRPEPGLENWGGRRTVFGSPWNYGSRLSVIEVVAAAHRFLGIDG